MVGGLSADGVVRVLRERLQLTDYPRDADVWRLLEIMEEDGEVRTRYGQVPAPYVMEDEQHRPVITLARGIPRSQQMRAVFEEVAHILLCGPGLAVLPPAGIMNGHRHYLRVEDRDEADANALWLAWKLPPELVLGDFHEGEVLERSGCSPEELRERLALLLR